MDEIDINSERSRLRAALVNVGHFASFAEAERSLEASVLHVVVGEEGAGSLAGQAALLTALAVGGRCFGRVTVSGNLDVPLSLSVPWLGKTLADAAGALEAAPGGNEAARTIVIGGSRSVRAWSVRPVWNGWCAGVVPGCVEGRPGRGDCPLAGVAAGALAVGEAFRGEQGDVRAGRVVQDFSLWEPQAQPNVAENPEMDACYLPLHLWLVGLGNLGQAYFWSLATLPYAAPESVRLFLQDDDVVGKENWGTSILVERGRYGELKTRVVERCAEMRGFQVRRLDRRLGSGLARQPNEPSLALAGLDKISHRRLLAGPGFEYVIDGGLGATASDFTHLRVNVFGDGFDLLRHFEGMDDRLSSLEALEELPAYQEIARTHSQGRCGSAMLAGQAVAAPFVSAVAGAFVVAQAVRLATGLAPSLTIKADVSDMRGLRAASGTAAERIRIPMAQAGKGC